MTNVRLKSIRCIEETSGGGSDDIYVLTLAVDLRETRLYPDSDQPIFKHEVRRFGPMDADRGDLLRAGRDYPDDRIWGTPELSRQIRESDDVVLMVAMIENDGEEPAQTEDLFRANAQEVLRRYSSVPGLSSRERRELVDNLTEIAVGRVRTPIFVDRDDVLGKPKEVLFSSVEFSATNPNLAIDRLLDFRGHGGRYQLAIQLFTRLSTGVDYPNDPPGTQRIVQSRNLRELADFDVGHTHNVTTLEPDGTRNRSSDAPKSLWTLSQVGLCISIRDGDSNRYVDAHEVESQQFHAVLRDAQGDETQKWIMIYHEDERYVSFQQLSGRRYLSAGLTSRNEAVVTKNVSDGLPDLWELIPHTNPLPGQPRVFIKHRDTGKYLFVVSSSAQEIVLADRPDLVAGFLLEPVGSLLRIKNAGTGRYLDAQEVGGRFDFSVVTSEEQNDQTQLWLLEATEENRATLRQVRNVQYLDAHEVGRLSDGRDLHFSAVTRPKQGDRTQEWWIV